ncbi:BatD family protein [Colwelliaceae bacterium BS250]
MVKAIKVSVFMLVMLLSNSVNAITSVSASIDKNPATVDESIVLTLIADDSVSADAFDSSVLQKDFIVGGTSVSSQTRMVNFDTTRTTQWTTLLIPRKAGSAVIPAITIEGVLSNPIRVKVLAKNSKGRKQQNDIYITADVSTTEMYVQQQFTLRVKLHVANELRRATLSEPKMTGAQIIQMGQDTESTQIIDGKRFRIFERLYTIKPESSGKFVLHSSMFSGDIIVGGQQRSLFASQARSKPISIKGKVIDINVKPVPESFQGDWLPSEIITVEDIWPSDASEFELGEPITRKVVITAAGLSEEQLPTLNFNPPSELKTYPDQAETSTNVQQGLLISQKLQEFAIVPTKPGVYTLPEVIIPWWNTKLNKVEQAIIPSKTITINGIAAPTPTMQSAPAEVQVITKQNTTLQWLFLSGWIITILAWVYTAKLKNKVSINKNAFSPSDKQSYLKLMAACKQNKGDEVLKLLPSWANGLYEGETFTNLSQVEQRLNNLEFSQALQQLQKRYFSANAGDWDGKELLKIISRLQTKTVQQQQIEIAINPR